VISQKKDDVFKLVKEIKNKYKAINGIIHAAGVIRDSFLIKKTKEEFQEVLLPKVYGSVWLDEATKDEELDFLVLFSSTVAVTGNVGQCDYAYANSFMDSFSEYRGALVKNCLRSGKTLSINWPLWKNGGMGIDDSTAAWLKDNMGILPLEDFEGCRTLDKALGYKTNRLTVFGGYREMIEKSINIDKTVKEQYEVKNGDCENLNTENIFEKTRLFLSDILAKELRIPVTSIKPDDAMEKLGIDSVMVMTLTRELEKYFGSLPKTLFFEYLSLKELVGYFVENHGEKLKKILVDTSSDPVYENHKQNNSSLDKQNERKEVTVNKRTRFLKGTGFERSCRGDSNSAINDDIAIIGISGRYPMADNLDEFWENLKSGKDCISEIPEERWDHSLYFDPDKDKPGVIYTKWGGFIRDVDKFDPLFFNISPREAELMDPQERLFLQTAWHTFEDAGYIREHLANTRTGVFAGVMYGQYQLFGAEEVMKGNMVAPGSSYATIANRVSYFFNLRGPSMAVDTMCSSSLTAIHLACQSIHKGEIEMALAGGVNVSIHPNKYLFLSQGKYASTDGRCRSFGEGGNGYVPGEGCGAVLLKPLKKAIKDRDTIYAVIKGSALNHGGKTNGYTVPNPAAQAELIMEAMKSANINAGDFGYIEAHGTGTSLGDPIELAGMVKAFSGFGIEKQSCPIGSVKSNVGHLEAAAGIVGITKIVLQMKYRQLVPSIHSKELNPNINFKDTPFYVQRELTDWNVKGDPLSETKNLRLAGISSFGAGGANAHIILQEYIDDRTVGQSATDGQYMIVLSAKNRDRLKEYAASLANFLRRYEGELRPDDVAYTLQVGREAMEERLSFFASSIEDIAEKLEKFYNNVMEEGVFTGNIRDSRPDVLPAIEEQEEYIKRLVSLKKYNELADMWINGAKLDWKLMYIELPRRISLPLYPFAKERYWIATSEKNDLFSGTDGTNFTL
jgi:3-oxoacyl-(acyl-carrier-protein) synthase/acyl carrier protein